VASGRCVALFRGINVGKAKRIAMADLRALFVRLGYIQVTTLLNSGNVVFTPVKSETAASTAASIEKAVADRLRVKSRVTVIAGKEVAEAVRKNPFEKIAKDPSRMLVLVPCDKEAATELKFLLKKDWKPEALALGKRVAWLWCAKGILDSPLWAEVNRTLGDRGTSRNMTTMTKLLDLCESPE
jgi:uncharacterized protein (DUF1697 family)